MRDVAKVKSSGVFVIMQAKSRSLHFTLVSIGLGTGIGPLQLL